MGVTSIQWTDRTWNPVRGCSVISPGCVNCYAMTQAHRFSGEGQPYHGLTKLTKAGPQWTGRLRPIEDTLLDPLSWRKPQRVFVNSMSDLFHEAVPYEFIDRVFAVMAIAHQHTFQVLTKRPERMCAYFADSTVNERVGMAMNVIVDADARAQHPGWFFGPDARWDPLPNVWLGVSVESQKYAGERIPPLLQTPAAGRFISAEPLLGPVAVDRWLYDTDDIDGGNLTFGLDWVIVGGESGAGARPFDLAWARSIIAQCEAAGTPVFVKQLGADPRGWCSWPHHDEYPPKMLDAHGCDETVGEPPFTLCHGVGDAWWPCRLKLKDRKGGDITEWPDDLRIRQFPAVTR